MVTEWARCDRDGAAPHSCVTRTTLSIPCPGLASDVRRELLTGLPSALAEEREPRGVQQKAGGVRGQRETEHGPALIPFCVSAVNPFILSPARWTLARSLLPSRARVSSPPEPTVSRSEPAVILSALNVRDFIRVCLYGQWLGATGHH